MGPFKCPDCGVWWVGPEHRCGVVAVEPYPVTTGGTGPLVIRPFPTPSTTGGTTSLPWCPSCHGFHWPSTAPCSTTIRDVDVLLDDHMDRMGPVYRRLAD